MSLSILIVCNGANLVGNNATGDRVLDVCDSAFDTGVDIGAVLEDTVTSRVEGAILKSHVVGIAEQLLTAEVAADELDVL